MLRLEAESWGHFKDSNQLFKISFLFFLKNTSDTKVVVQIKHITIWYSNTISYHYINECHFWIKIFFFKKNK